MTHKHTVSAAAIALALAVASPGAQQDTGRSADDNGAFRFKSGVELINVTTTVSDCERPFRPGSAQGRFRGLRRRPAGRDHSLQLRAGARQPGDCARHQRQHGRRQDSGGAERAAPLPVRPARQRGRDLSLSLQQLPRPAAGLDERSAASGPRPRSGHAKRRHGDVRRGGGSGAAGARGPVPQEGARRDFRRQRHRKPDHDPRVETADSRERSAGVRDRYRRRERGTDVSTCATTTAAAAAAADPVPLPRSRSRRTAISAAARRAGRRLARQSQRRSGQRRRASRHDRRQRRAHGSRSAMRAISIRRPRPSPTN